MGTATASPPGITGVQGRETETAARPRRSRPAGPSRRAFLRTSFLLGWLATGSGFGAASLAFLWPQIRGGFGAVFDVGTEDEVLANIEANNDRWEFPAGRTLFVAYDPRLDPAGRYAELTNGTRVMALYWRCPHLGCKVPWCDTSRWWECPCHGSRYNRWGEYQAGPAPRGLDRFRVRNEQGRLLLDTSAIVTGPARGSGVLDQPPEGPACV